MNRFKVSLSTDGSCRNNPGQGGYWAILRFGEHMTELGGYDERTTNNRMELTAVIEAVRALKKPCDIALYTDSMYVINGINGAKENYARGWKTRSGAKMVNADLWQELTDVKAAGKHKFQCIHVKGHTGNPDNERCDQMAKQQIQLHTLGEG